MLMDKCVLKKHILQYIHYKHTILSWNCDYHSTVSSIPHKNVKHRWLMPSFLKRNILTQSFQCSACVSCRTGWFPWHTTVPPSFPPSGWCRKARVFPQIQKNALALHVLWWLISGYCSAPFIPVFCDPYTMAIVRMKCPSPWSFIF